MKQFIKKVLASHSGISSKRLCDVIGWLIVIITLFYCAITCKQAPTMIDTFMFCCLGLLGIDSITDIWKKE